MISRTVVIDQFDSNKACYGDEYAIVAIDIIRATTTAVTGVAAGRTCFPVPTIEEAIALASRLPDPLLMGEQNGKMPEGFDLQNSPAQLHKRSDVHRPMILLSSSGTRLIAQYRHHPRLYVACLRNFRAVVRHLADHHAQVALIGAGTRGEFREEDQLCCAWMAEELLEHGYVPEDELTASLIDRWSGQGAERILEGNSAAYLRRSGQTEDIDFILSHINDLDSVYQLHHDRIFALAQM